jgi:membrane protein
MEETTRDSAPESENVSSESAPARQSGASAPATAREGDGSGPAAGSVTGTLGASISTSLSATWKPVPRALLRATRKFGSDGCFNHAAAISYFALLSVAPFLSFLASAMGYLLGSSEEGVEAAMERFSSLVPGLGPQVTAMARAVIEHSGTIGLASLAVTIWVASFVFISIQIAVGQIFRQPRAHRSWRHLALSTLWETIKPFLLFLLSTTLLILAFAAKNIVAVLRSATPEGARTVIEFFESIPTVPVLGSGLLSVVVFVVILQVLTARILPWRALLPAAVVGAVGWEMAKYLFAFYLGYVSRALTFSGSAAAAVVFMLWIYYAAVVLLYSAEVAAVLSGNDQ